MNTFNDNEYDRVCDENEKLKAEVERLRDQAQYDAVQATGLQAEIERLEKERDTTHERWEGQLRLNARLVTERDRLRAELELTKERRIHWQDLAYAGMRVIDAVAGNRIEHGHGVTEDTCNLHAQMAIDKVGFLKQEIERLREERNCSAANELIAREQWELMKQQRDEARQIARTLANGGALGGNWRDPYPWLREGGDS